MTFEQLEEEEDELMIFQPDFRKEKKIFLIQDCCAENKYDSYFQTLHLAEIFKIYSE